MTEPHDHCPSYYAATRNDDTRYPALEGGCDAEVCVVGGGFSGVATALTLAERGFSVALVEANRIGWGASGRNGGQMIGGMNGEPAFRRQIGEAAEDFLWSVYYRGNEIVETRIATYGIDCDYKRGWMLVANKPRQMHDIAHEIELHERHGLGDRVRLVEKAGMREYLGTDAYHGALVTDLSGHLHPLNLCLGEARAAASLGVRIFERSEVVEIEHGPRPVVKTRQGAVRAETVVLAGGAYHRLERSRLAGLVFPTGSYIVATEPLDEATVAELNPHDMAVCDSNVVLDYYRLSADRRLLYGGRCNYSNREPRDIAGSITPRMLEVFPQLGGRRIDYAWGGKIGIVINRVPAVGRVDDNVYYLQGYSGHGVNVSHIAAEVVADAVQGQMERFDMFARIRHTRIPAPQWMASQLLALGMLYYRLKDLA